ncbi:MAG: hypothetical protein AMJ81_02190 [Phycisphaerae bacterium SM23_33]|nr:MAG: hypothetical protein AMJ81_02190 [Phycisphaerae bacterium SM23_33]
MGAVKPADVSKESFSVGHEGGVVLRAARNGYVSFRLWVIGAGEYRLAAEFPGGLEADLFRAWYHRMAADGREQARAEHCADALVLVEPGAAASLPDPDNAIEAQTHQEYWVDVFVSADAPAGTAAGRITLVAKGARVELPVEIQVLEAVIPDEDVLVCDHNSYGCRWLAGMYPSVFAGCADEPGRWARTIELLQHYYRICHEHRGLFSNLGAGHHGGFDPIYGPAARGAGRERRLEDWGLFDRHYGPLLDGSAFAAAGPGAPRPRRPARPAWGVYTPINADWPADYLWWGQPGYEVEFARGVGQFDEHFRRNGWLTTRPYFFFNHKKRYRWFEWDGDEPKYARDDAYWLEMGRLFQQAVGDTPVPWAFRMAASWQMKHHFEQLAGVVDFWVCGGFAGWYPDEIRRVVARGDVVWTYSGTPGIGEPSAALLEHVWRMWARGVSGHCEWLTTNPGPDPWFHCDGAQTGMIYPGERFGIAGPIPSARLKLQRNAVQDLNLIHARAKAAGRLEKVRQKLGKSVPVSLWERPPPIVRQQPPELWDSHNLSATQDDNMARHAGLDPLWWVPIRRAALGGEVSQ